MAANGQNVSKKILGNVLTLYSYNQAFIKIKKTKNSQKNEFL